MVEARRLLASACLTAASIVLVSSLAAAAEKKIVLEGKFGRVVSNSLSKLDPPADVELAQEVRVDHLTSADPDWNDATLTVYEQNLSYPSHGTYRAYGVINTKTGDTAYIELTGKWDVVNRDGKFSEAPFDGQGKLLGGTGKLQGISGPVVVKGRVSAEQVGTYSVEMNVPH
jgi:hypothetical protein